MSLMSEKQVFSIEIQSVKPHYTGVIKDSVSGESFTFNSAGQQINFIVKHTLAGKPEAMPDAGKN